MVTMEIQYHFFPRTEPPPHFTDQIITAFRNHVQGISTFQLSKGLTSDAVLAQIRPDLIALGFEVEGGKTRDQKIQRPVFYGAQGKPTPNTKSTHTIQIGNADWKLKPGEPGWEMRSIAT